MIERSHVYAAGEDTKTLSLTTKPSGNGNASTQTPAAYGVYLKAAGLALLDVDSDKPEGSESYEKLQSVLGPASFQSALQAFTPSGGYHFYFAVNDDAVFEVSLQDYPGIELKHEGYTVLPPSYAKGRNGAEGFYEWEGRSNLNRAEFTGGSNS